MPLIRAARLSGPAILVLAVAAFTFSSDNPPDWHVTSTPASAICLKSAFVHGYMHGYEQGFHAADLDLQMGRDARDPVKLKEYRDVAGYRNEFGDKHSFAAGYREGVRVGYADAFAGRHFRAVNGLRTAALGLPQAAGIQPNKLFDQGFATGYGAGRQQGLRDGRAGVDFQNVGVTCHGGKFHPFRRTDDYCAGYGRGYGVGYADGYINQAPSTLASGAK